jgi:hypothetical protein
VSRNAPSKAHHTVLCPATPAVDPMFTAGSRAHLAKGTAAQLPFTAVIPPRHLDVTRVYVPLAPGHVWECHVRALCAMASHRSCRAADKPSAACVQCVS